MINGNQSPFITMECVLDVSKFFLDFSLDDWLAKGRLIAFQDY
jgi:hypothetical protein